MSVNELEHEDFNLNIRRYVDNSLPPEPHDVRAHLHGGVPSNEIKDLQSYLDNYSGVVELLFQPRETAYSANGNSQGESFYFNFANSSHNKDFILRANNAKSPRF